MAVYVTEDGRRLEARRSRELIDKMRGESWSGPDASRFQWMHEVAGRAKMSAGHRVRCNNDTNFVRDLIKAGLIKKESA